MDFSQPLAVKLAELCKASYDQFDAYQKKASWTPPEGYSLEAVLTVPYENDKMPIGFLTRIDGTVVVVWRGTDDFEEWVEDAKFEQVPCSFFENNDRVEVGFLELYTKSDDTAETPREQLISFFESRLDEKQVIVTGHSLGGALATLNAYDFARKSFNVSVYTFASPRTGDPNFCANFGSKEMNSWRVYNTNDEVPRLPPEHSPPLFSIYHYSHVGQEKAVTFGSGLALAEDHAILGYVQAVEKLS